MADTEIELSALHDAILASVVAAFPAVATVADYQEQRTRLALPAILVELDDLEASPDDDPGTEQLAVVARWTARIIIGFRTPAAEREIRRLAAAFAHHVHGNRWGQPVEPARVTVAAPDAFDVELDQYVVWSVEWEQILHLGVSVWTNEGDVIPTAYLGFAPEIGPGHEDDYVEMDGCEGAGP